MEFWALKFWCLSCWHSTFLLVACYLPRLFYVSSSSNSKTDFCNFLKFCETTTNMMRLCLLWPSTNRVLLWKLVIRVKFWRCCNILENWGQFTQLSLANLDSKMVILMFSRNSHFWLPLHLSFQNVCKVQYMC